MSHVLPRFFRFTVYIYAMSLFSRRDVGQAVMRFLAASVKQYGICFRTVPLLVGLGPPTNRKADYLVVLNGPPCTRPLYGLLDIDEIHCVSEKRPPFSYDCNFYKG